MSPVVRKMLDLFWDSSLPGLPVLVGLVLSGIGFIGAEVSWLVFKETATALWFLMSYVACGVGLMLFGALTLWLQCRYLKNHLARLYPRDQAEPQRRQESPQ